MTFKLKTMAIALAMTGGLVLAMTGVEAASHQDGVLGGKGDREPPKLKTTLGTEGTKDDKPEETGISKSEDSKNTFRFWERWGNNEDPKNTRELGNDKKECYKYDTEESLHGIPLIRVTESPIKLNEKLYDEELYALNSKLEKTELSEKDRANLKGRREYLRSQLAIISIRKNIEPKQYN